MIAHNEHTGDLLRSKAATEAYGTNFDNIFGKRKPLGRQSTKMPNFSRTLHVGDAFVLMHATRDSIVFQVVFDESGTLYEVESFVGTDKTHVEVIAQMNSMPVEVITDIVEQMKEQSHVSV